MRSSSSPMDETEELRNMLRSADDQNRVRFSGTNVLSAASVDREVSELASLLGSLDREGLRTSIPLSAPPAVLPSSGASASSSWAGAPPLPPNSRRSEYNFDLPSASIEDLQDELSSSSLASSVTSAAPHGAPLDSVDHTVVRFHQNYAIRGRYGLYLTTAAQESAPAAQEILLGTTASNTAAPLVNANAAKTYLLGVEGQGVGEEVDCMNFVPVETKEIDGPIKYGQVIAIKSPSSKERLLGLRDGQRIGFWRHVVGQGEKWMILKAQSGFSAVGGATHYLGSEDVSARGEFVRVGDTVLLQTYKSENLLSIHEGGDTQGRGAEPRLLYRERTGLGAELWQIEVFGAVPLPAWVQHRPYLSGKYLVLPPTHRSPAPEVEARTFPRSAATHAQGDVHNPLPHAHSHPLHDFSLSEQHYVFMRELLLLLSGIEGHYLRVAASPSPSTANNNATTGSGRGKGSYPYESTSTQRSSSSLASALPRLREIKLVVDVESADKSSATQVSLLLSLCESVLRVRDFVRQHSRYEYGVVSHALCAAVKRVLRDLDVVVCQLEFLLNTQRLTLQKLVFLLQPSQRTLTLLARVCERLREKTGGALLNALYVCVLEQGDEKARALCEELLRCAAEPFLKMLSLWIFRGELHDPYKEFMISEDASLSKEALQEDFNAQYWESRFSLSASHTPQWLSSHAHKALAAGKYLAVVRDCLGDAALRERERLARTEKDRERDAELTLPMEQTLSLSFIDSDPNSQTQASSSSSLSLADRALSICLAIERAHSSASRALLTLLRDPQCALPAHLLSLGRFFLLQHGDFFTHLMDATESELRKEAREVSLSRLSHALSLAVQTSSLASDPHRENLHCSLASHNLMQHLHLIQIAGETGYHSHTSAASAGTAASGIGGGGAQSASGLPSYAEVHSSLSAQGLKGIEAFTLGYSVQWPVSLVLSKRVITKYQLLSRLLYFSKHVERRLLCAWQTHQETKGMIATTHAPLRASYLLRQRMVHFMQNFVYYITLEVIHPRSHTLQREMESANDMDEVLDLHERFLDSCLKECLLASQDLLKILTKIMTTCLLFADHMSKFLSDALAAQENANINANATANTRAANKSSLALVAKKDGKESKDKDSPQKRVSSGNAAEDRKEREREREWERLKRDVEMRRVRSREMSEVLQRETQHDSFARILNKFTHTFDDQLKEFLDNLWTTSHRHHAQLANLCVRLDYNGFYSAQFAPQNP